MSQPDQARSDAVRREPSRCERCGRFVGEEALEGWSGGLFGDYNGLLYCAFGVGGCGRNLDHFADGPDDLQRRTDEIARGEYAAEANLDLQRVYSGLMTVEEFEERYGR